METQKELIMDQVQERLMDKGVYRRVHHRVKIATKIAAEELITDPSAPTRLKRNTFRRISCYELEALASIKQFLEINGFNNTLQTLNAELGEIDTSRDACDLKKLARKQLELQTDSSSGDSF